MLRPLSNTSRIRTAFSMAELMIAIVILGIGMLMIATMFPVAWTRARDMAEFTTQTNVANNAAETVAAKTVISVVLPPGAPAIFPSFVGDLSADGTQQGDPATLPLVHYLSSENQLATNPGAANAYQSDFYDSLAPGLLDVSIDGQLATVGGFAPAYAGNEVSVIKFNEHLIPPLSARPTASGLPEDDIAKAHWDLLPPTRRFSWAAFNRFDKTPVSRSEVRNLTMYYVTLRRPEPTSRYARQARAGAYADTTALPTALASTEDMRFPMPWLIELDVRGNWDSTVPGPQGPSDPTGIPSEAIAGGSDDSKLIAQMLQKGSMLIDRLTGAVYTVKSHRYTKDATGSEYDTTAVITLDREVQVADLDPLATGSVQVGVTADAADPVSAGNSNGTIRPFWTFPPPIERTGSTAADFVFVGKQPVVGVEIRPLVKRP